MLVADSLDEPPEGHAERLVVEMRDRLKAIGEAARLGDVGGQAGGKDVDCRTRNHLVGLVLDRQPAVHQQPGGVCAIVIPVAPYRCPPGPYERAAQIAANLTHAGKKKAKIMILDAKDAFSKQALFTEGWKHNYGDMIQWVGASAGGKGERAGAAPGVESLAALETLTDIVNAFEGIARQRGIRLGHYAQDLEPETQGSILEETLVRENQIVEKGDILVRISNEMAQSTLKDVASQALEHKAAIARLQQAGIGIAEAIDGSPDAIDRKATAPRPDYRGPTESGAGDMKIEKELWERYDFDLGNGAMLFDGDTSDPRNIQINSVENYIAFHVVSLMEKIRNTEGALPLNSVVLACTHYPFFTGTFRNEFSRLRDYRENGEYIYRELISGDLIIVNPAVEVADQLYRHLASKQLLNEGTGQGSEFYISVPGLTNKQVQLRDDGSFTYEYKYGRKAGEIQEYVKVVPFSRRSIPDDVLKRLSVQIPGVWDLITEFSTASPKTLYFNPSERIKGE